jgi:hypothetical protein
MSAGNNLFKSLTASQEDWQNREFNSTIQFSVLKMVEFLNRFGMLVSSGALLKSNITLANFG